MSDDYKNYLCASDKWSAIDCPIFAPACNDLGLALPMLAKATWVLGYPIGIILDNGQALIDDDLSNYTKLWIVPEKSTYLMERFLISNVISM